MTSLASSLILSSLAAQAMTLFGGASIHWYENRGQWPETTLYGMQLTQGWATLERDGVVLHLVSDEPEPAAHEIALRFEGASPAVEVEPLRREPGVHHYYFGEDPAGWILNVHTFESVRLVGLYPGVHLDVHEVAGALKYDLQLAPGADLSQVVLRFEGVDHVTITPEGNLSLVTPLGSMAHPHAASWQVEADGSRTPVMVSYAEISPGRFELQAPNWDSARPLVIDPEMNWCTYYGGSGPGSINDAPREVVVDRFGDVTIAGTAQAPTSLMTPGTFQSPSLSDDLFVVKFHQTSGELIYSARIGSTSQDEGRSVAVDDQGRATVVGWVGQGAAGFPTTPGSFDPVKEQFDRTAVAFRLNRTGDELEYSTYLEAGGTSTASWAYGVQVAGSGAAIIMGKANSANFPTTPGAYSSQVLGSVDIFLTRLDPTGSSLDWSTFVGGTGSENPEDMVIAPNEDLVLTGYTNGSFPTTLGALKPNFGNGREGFIARIRADGADLVWSTYFGGSQDDIPFEVALLPDDDVIVVGYTDSSDFPTTPGSYQEVKELREDGFVSRLDSTGSVLLHSTFLGGVGVNTFDILEGVCVDASGVVTAVGGNGIGFPVTPGAFQPINASRDFTVTRLSPDFSRLFYSARIGGDFQDQALAVAASPTGLLTVVGLGEPNFPTTPNALFPTFLGGNRDSAFCTFQPLLDGVTLRAKASASCLGLLQINATSMPVAGQPLSIFCSQAPQNSTGVLMIFDGQLPPTIQTVTTDEAGFVENDVGTLPATVGTRLAYRYRFPADPSCPGAESAHSQWLVVRTQ